MIICDECGYNVINSIKFNNKTICCNCHFNLIMAKGMIEYLCSICDEVRTDVCKRVEFNHQLMCDLCWDKACSNALNNGPGDSIIYTKAFNEIKKSNNKRG